MNEKDLGQHFLINEDILDLEIEMAGLSKKDKVVEIGAGNGVLTERIAEKAGKVLAFEIDEKFKPELRRIESKNKNLSVRYEDALKGNWKGYNKIVSNIPYYLSEAIIIKSIREEIKEIVLIVGEEFKEKLRGESKVGFIAGLFYDIEYIKEIGKESFSPEPRTNSWIVKLKRIDGTSKIKRLMRKISVGKGKLKGAIVNGLMDEGVNKRKAKEIAHEIGLDEGILNKPCIKTTYELLKRIEKKFEAMVF